MYIVYTIQLMWTALHRHTTTPRTLEIRPHDVRAWNIDFFKYDDISMRMLICVHTTHTLSVCVCVCAKYMLCSPASLADDDEAIETWIYIRIFCST